MKLQREVEMNKKPKRNYVNNPEFLQAIIVYKASCKEAEESGEPDPQIPNYIGECIYQIANRLATKPNFSGYTYKDEMISDGLENAIQALGNFDPEKSNYTTLFRSKVTESSVIHGTAVEHDEINADGPGEAAYIDLNNDYMNDFVTSFEKRMETKKTQQRKKRGLEKFMGDDDGENSDPK
jgi:hypothetical protein